MADRAQLASKLLVEIDPKLLELALTHSSYAYENGGANNERLEFLGDSILGFLVTNYIFETHPELPEGELTKLKNAVVSAPALATAATRISLGDHLLLGRGEEQTGGRQKPNLLADAFEALLGAAFLSAGIEGARAIVEAHIYPLLADPDAIREASDPKTALIELLARLALPQPHYEITFTGPDHDRIFTAIALTGDRELGRGEGTTRRGAELVAAAAAIRTLREDSRTDGPATGGFQKDA
jgi:ribonuclease-3